MDANQLNSKSFSKELWIETFWDIDQPWMHVLQLVFRNKKRELALPNRFLKLIFYNIHHFMLLLRYSNEYWFILQQFIHGLSHLIPLWII